MNIQDVSPTRSNTNASDIGHSVTGRTLAIACSPDGQTLYAGSYSGVWQTDDGGANWTQLTWPQPPPDQFDVPGALGGWCVVDLAVGPGWRVEKHPRVLARLRRRRSTHRFVDIVGFGDCGVWTALGNGDGSFQSPNVVLPAFGYQAGGWQVDKHPRFVADLTADGAGDIVGFGDAGVWTAIGKGDGTFQQPKFVKADFGYDQGWRVENHPRFVVDLDGDGRADILGFGDAGVWIAIGDGQGGFGEVRFVHQNFGYEEGWRVDRHPRFVADLDADGRADIIGFGDAGVWVALQNADGTFRELPVEPVLADFGTAQGWRVDRHPRFVVDLDGDGHPDIIGFGDQGVWTALTDGHGGFQQPRFTPGLFSYDHGWRVDQHPRFVVDLNGDGIADIVGFGDAGVWTAIGNGDGTFKDAQYVHANFGVEQGWRVDRHPRFVRDLNADGRADIVGFGDAGVWTALSDGHGGFPTSNFVQANFGYGTIVLALIVNDVAKGSRGLWRSPDGGTTWMNVQQFPGGLNLGQIQWALGSDHLVYVAGGNSLLISKDAGLTFKDVVPWGTGPAANVNHIAVWQNEPADPSPAAIYALGDSAMFLSFDGGATWMRDKGALPKNMGGLATPVANFNTPSVMAISPRFPLEVFVAQNGSSGGNVLHRGDYSHFPFGDQISSWDTLPLPDLLTSTDTQDAGNVFLVTTRKHQGDLLFYGPQRWFQNFEQAVAYVGPLDPQSASDWHKLGVVHADLHGLLLSPDFHASIRDGKYQPGGGTVWLLSDGGIYRSANGGQKFDPAIRAQTLSCMSVAGVALPGKGPALSLNSGDNDGFYSMNGGQNWSYQQYGGGDNDCAFADSLRPNSIMVFTPRWNTAGDLADSTRHGQTVSVYEARSGHLPDASATGHDRRAVVGPPTVADDPNLSGNAWNANSGFAEVGFRPIVLGLPGENAPAQGDYVFILLNPALLPSPSQPLLVRTQNILDIKHRDEWVTTATGPGQGANVFLQGPPLPGAKLAVVQASGGHANTVFYVGGDGTLWTWRDGAVSWNQLVPAAPIAGRSAGAKSAMRVFVHPYQPNVVYLLDTDHVKRSDDGGITWNVDQSLEMQLRWKTRIQISANDDTVGIGEHFDLVLTDMQFDPNNPLVRFAIGIGGVFMTTDGLNWTRLLHTGALPGRPSSCYYDWVSNPPERALYVAFAGRSLVKISLPPAWSQGDLTTINDIVSVSGHFGTGDQRHLVVVGTTHGKVHEIFWKAAQQGIEGEDDLPVTFGAGTIVSVASLYNSDQQRHVVVVGTTAGKVHEIFWKADTVGIEGHDDLPVTFPAGSIVAVSGLYNSDQQRHVVVVGTTAGKVHEIFWKADTVGIEGHDDLPVTFPAGSIVAVTAFYNPDQQRHVVVVGTRAGKLHEIFWKADTVGVEGHDDLPVSFGSDAIVAVSGFYDSNKQRYVVIVGTTDGSVHQVYWKDTTIGIEAHSTVTKFNAHSIVGLAGFYSSSDQIEHIVVGLANGLLRELWVKPDS
jgi:hypothetical protein